MPTSGHYIDRDSTVLTVLVIVLYLIWSKVHQEPFIEVGSQSPADEI